jgi:hypothetical protein
MLGCASARPAVARSERTARRSDEVSADHIQPPTPAFRPGLPNPGRLRTAVFPLTTTPASKKLSGAMGLTTPSPHTPLPSYNLSGIHNCPQFLCLTPRVQSIVDLRFLPSLSNAIRRRNRGRLSRKTLRRRKASQCETRPMCRWCSLCYKT